MSRLNFADALSSSPAHKYSEYSSRDSISDFTGFKVRHLQQQSRRQVENSRKPGMKNSFNRIDFQQKMIIPQKTSFDKNILGVIFFDHRGPRFKNRWHGFDSSQSQFCRARKKSSAKMAKNFVAKVLLSLLLMSDGCSATTTMTTTTPTTPCSPTFPIFDRSV